jgi:hypothetical protein
MCQCDDNYSKKHFCIYKCTLVRVSEMFTIQITFLKMFLQNFGKTMYYIVKSMVYKEWIENSWYQLFSQKYEFYIMFHP